MTDESIQQRDARGPPDHLRMHGENEMAAQRTDTVELFAPDCLDRAGGLYRAIHLSRTESKIGPVVEDPLDRQLDQRAALVTIGADIGHELAGIFHAMTLEQVECHRAHVPGGR